MTPAAGTRLDPYEISPDLRMRRVPVESEEIR